MVVLNDEQTSRLYAMQRECGQLHVLLRAAGEEVRNLRDDLRDAELRYSELEKHPGRHLVPADVERSRAETDRLKEALRRALIQEAELRTEWTQAKQLLDACEAYIAKG